MNGLWIEATGQDEGVPSLRVLGRLVGTAVDILMREYQDAQRAGRPPALDLSGLTFVSSAGARLLCELRRRGARIVGLTPLLRETLDDESTGAVPIYRDGPAISGPDLDP